MMEYVFVDDLHRYKRLKVTRACESCRRRKVKCDGGSGGTQTPCSSCRKLKIDCIFSNMMKRAAPKTEAEQMDERLQRIENILHKLDESDNKGKRVCSIDYVESLTDVLGHMKIEQNGRAHYIYADGTRLKEGDEKSLVLAEPPLPLPVHMTGLIAPQPELANHLIQLYFRHVHPYVPIIHKADFFRRLNDKTNSRPISPLLLYSVYAMASRFSDDPATRLDPMKPETAGLAFYTKAKESLDDYLDAPRLSTIQAQILLLKYQEGVRRSGLFFRSWLYFGTIIRMAKELGLDKSFNKFHLNISREDLLIRRRVWQTCFLCDQFMSGAQGCEASIYLSSTDIELPSKEDYDDEEEFQIQTDFTHLVRLTKILSSVTTIIAPAGSIQAWDSSPMLQTLDAALDAWIMALPPRLQCTPPTLEATNSSLPRPPVSHFAGFLNMLYHTILILLHRPYITSIDNGKISPPHPQHVNICTVAANSISQIAQSMYETWGQSVFQYPLRGGNYGVYCLVAASMIHLVNMASPDLRFSRPAHDHLLRTLKVLKHCVEHSAAWELRDKVQALEAAFTAQQARQSIVMMFHPGANPPAVAQPQSYRARRPIPKRRCTTQNTTSVLRDDNQHLLSSSLPANLSHFPHSAATTPQFNDRPLYLLSEDTTMEPQQLLDPSNPDHNQAVNQPFDFLTPHAIDDGSMLNPSLVSMPLASQVTVPTTDTFDPMMSKSLDLSGSVDPSNAYWDANSVLIWPNPSQNVWPGNGSISPVSISTSPSVTTAASDGHQSPNNSASSPSLEHIQSSGSSPQLTPAMESVIVQSQHPAELMIYSDY